MTVQEALEKIYQSAFDRGMSGDDIYFTFLHGIHAKAVAATRELAENKPPIN